MKYLARITVLLSGALLLYFTSDFANFGDSTSPAATHLSPYFIENSISDSAVPNVVTSLLADYRGFDTMFETTVVLTAGLSCFLLLRVFRKEKISGNLVCYRHLATGLTLRFVQNRRPPEGSTAFLRVDPTWVPYDVIVSTVSRKLVPFIQLFALYVITHGHHSPGGGFQGGVILAAAIILLALSSNLAEAERRMSENKAAILSTIGVFIYAGIGFLCLALGVNFLDYSGLMPILGVGHIMARSDGILGVEVGVALAVMSVMIWIYYNLSSAGRHNEGL